MVQDVFGLCWVSSGAEADEPLQTRREGHERALENARKHSQAGRSKGPSQECTRMEGGRREEESHKEGV